MVCILWYSLEVPWQGANECFCAEISRILYVWYVKRGNLAMFDVKLKTTRTAYNMTYTDLPPASVAQLDAPSDWRPGGRGFNARRGRQHSFMEIDHEIFSTVILSLPLIQEGQLSVSGERMCTILVNRLKD